MGLKGDGKEIALLELVRAGAIEEDQPAGAVV